MKDGSLKDYSAVIVVHDYIPSVNGENLRKYLFQKNITSLLYIAHPLLYVKKYKKKPSRFEYFENGTVSRKVKTADITYPEIFSYIKDFILTIYWCISFRKRWDLFVGLDNLNAIAGIVLKKFGFVDKVVYYTIDYFPNRFQNKPLNWIYHSIDTLCVKYADETWNVNKRMAQARFTHKGLDPKIYNQQYAVPLGIWFHETKRKSFEKINQKKLVYIGNLVDYMGVDLIIKAMPDLVQKIPGISLDIIGGGDELENLKNLTKKLHVTKNVTFYGWVNDRKEIEKLLSTAAVGMAPFNTNLLAEEVKNADPVKIKDYMSLGMPIIVTKAISNYKEIEKTQAGIVINYNVDELIAAVVVLLTNQALLKKYRLNALRFVEKFDWASLFQKNVKRILEK